MNSSSSIIKVVFTIFAVIGVLAVLVLLGMVFMHGGTMHSFSNMMSACLSRMKG